MKINLNNKHFQTEDTQEFAGMIIFSESICGVNRKGLPIKYGVVQGSTLGPILFLIYAHNISNLKLLGKIFLVADNTLISVDGANLKEA